LFIYLFFTVIFFDLGIRLESTAKRELQRCLYSRNHWLHWSPKFWSVWQGRRDSWKRNVWMGQRFL